MQPIDHETFVEFAKLVRNATHNGALTTTNREPIIDFVSNIPAGPQRTQFILRALDYFTGDYYAVTFLRQEFRHQ